MRAFAVFMLTTLATGGVFAESFTGKVVEAPQPDLLVVEGPQGRVEVRLYGADAPEKGQPGFDEAVRYVSERALEQEVTVEPVTTDSLGKTVGRVLLPGYVNLNYALVDNGFAWWDEPNTPEDGALKKYNASALVAKKGLWSNEAPLAPWDYRKSHGFEDYTYALKKEAPAPEEKEEKEEPKMLQADGKGKYEASAYNYSAAGIEIDESELDVPGLVGKHMPRIEKDADGKPLGFTANDISQIPFASQLGFQDGDIIAGVNGTPITNEGAVWGLIQQHKNTKKFQVDVIRGGRPVTINIDVP